MPVCLLPWCHDGHEQPSKTGSNSKLNVFIYKLSYFWWFLTAAVVLTKTALSPSNIGNYIIMLHPYDCLNIRRIRTTPVYMTEWMWKISGSLNPKKQNPTALQKQSKNSEIWTNILPQEEHSNLFLNANIYIQLSIERIIPICTYMHVITIFEEKSSWIWWGQGWKEEKEDQHVTLLYSQKKKKTN